MELHKLFGLFLVISMASNINAEPSSSITWEKEEPATSFDTSMLRMQRHNRELWIPRLMKELDRNNTNLKQDNHTEAGGVAYDWSENKISIYVNLIGAPTEAQCTGALNKYKKIISPYTAPMLNNLEFQSKSPQKDVDKEKEIFFEFTVGISDAPGQFGKSIICSSRMDSDAPSIKKYYWQ